MEVTMPGQVLPVADERDGLLSYLTQQRYTLRLTAFGLTDEQARETPTRSTLSVGGLINHAVSMEHGWIDIVLQRSRPPLFDYQVGFLLESHETVAAILELYDEIAKESEGAIGGIADLGQAVSVPKDVPWFPKDVDAWSVRWVLLHLIEETARHAGHADIIRESVDGATAFPLMTAAEGWPSTTWLQPWEPSA
jgi:uncharacterized damage-inducible protein DinB